MPAVLHEDTPQRPTTFKGRMRVATEQQIECATRDGRMKAVAIRSGNFFGTGIGTWLDLVMAKDLESGKLVYPGALNVPTAWAYLPDLARTFVKVAEQRHRLPAFETLHFAGMHLTGNDWAGQFAVVAREQGWLKAEAKLRVSSLSWPLMRALGWVMPTMAAVCEMRYLWSQPYALANTNLLALIGEEPRTPFPQAVQAAFAELGKLAPQAVDMRDISLSLR